MDGCNVHAPLKYTYAGISILLNEYIEGTLPPCRGRIHVMDGCNVHAPLAYMYSSRAGMWYLSHTRISVGVSWICPSTLPVQAQAGIKKRDQET